MRVEPGTYTRIAAAAVVALSVIVLSGAAVRLTGSGLGCSDWPTCTEDQFVAPAEFHASVEFANRLFTGVVSLAVLAALVGAYRRRPRRSDLIWLSWCMVAGVLANAILGGLTVLWELNPLFVMSHFALSILLLWAAIVTWFRSREHDGPREFRVDRTSGWVATALVVLAGLVLAAGTVVTGTGPNGGDETVERLELSLREVARVHSVLALAMVATLVYVSLRLSGRFGGTADEKGRRIAAALMGLSLIQGALGYWQYFAGVPELLVGVHVLGSIGVWLGALYLWLSLREPVRQQTSSSALAT